MGLTLGFCLVWAAHSQHTLWAAPFETVWVCPQWPHTGPKVTCLQGCNMKHVEETIAVLDNPTCITWINNTDWNYFTNITLFYCYNYLQWYCLIENTLISKEVTLLSVRQSKYIKMWLFAVITFLVRNVVFLSYIVVTVFGAVLLTHLSTVSLVSISISSK